MKRGGVYIKINLLYRQLSVYKANHLFGSYPIAIGKPSTPSPVGNWTIVNKAIMDGRKVYGTRWMGLSKNRYGIHGTNNPSCIGKAVSLGCIRMHNKDIETIFPLISIGTPVEIYSGTNTKSGSVHIVKQGESLWNISKTYGISLQDILSLNPHINPDLIYPGQKIKVKF